ncbi:MAG: lipoyl(octanoyl) transferase LipB [Gammaproteobacteria bacterium]|nr:lipoyl(octanoyl) transferase LipB [Gammaproteobacteria bacterium]
MSANIDRLDVRHLGLQEYSPIYAEMQVFNDARQEATTDQFWVVQHYPVYTLGKNGKPEHVINPGKIPVVQVDRGGQVTYHGPGQLVVYLMLDIKRKKLGVRQVVTAMESALIATLAQFEIEAYAKPEAPGVYVGNKKIASLGLRIRNGKSYHGLALNYDMDLAPFSGINPCGYEGLEVTQFINEARPANLDEIEKILIRNLAKELHYTEIRDIHD